MNFTESTHFSCIVNIASFCCHYIRVEVFLFSFFDGLVLLRCKVLEERSDFTWLLLRTWSRWPLNRRVCIFVCFIQPVSYFVSCFCFSLCLGLCFVIYCYWGLKGWSFHITLIFRFYIVIGEVGIGFYCFIFVVKLLVSSGQALWAQVEFFRVV
jgi:hypothetical protein